MEKSREQKIPLFLAFVDLTKAFDLVDWKPLCTVLAKGGCPPTPVALIRSFRDEMFAKVQFDGYFSDASSENVLSKDACWPLHFLAYISHMFSKQYMLTCMQMLVCLCFLKMMVIFSTWHVFKPEPRFKSLLFMSYYMLMMLHFVHHLLNSFKTF